MDSTMYVDFANGFADGFADGMTEGMTEGLTMGTSMIDGVLGLIGAYSFIVLALAVVSIIAQWKIFSKAGKPGWASLVPVYNMVVMFQIVGLNPWLLILFVVPFVNFVAIPVLGIMMAFRLAKSFGKDIGWGFGLLFLSFIFNLILAFGSSEYVGPNGQA